MGDNHVAVTDQKMNCEHLQKCFRFGPNEKHEKQKMDFKDCYCDVRSHYRSTIFLFRNTQRLPWNEKAQTVERLLHVISDRAASVMQQEKRERFFHPYRQKLFPDVLMRLRSVPHLFAL